nr:hypothetical protein [Tanacetum cinerariifolium]
RPFSVSWIANLALCDWEGGERGWRKTRGDVGFGLGEKEGKDERLKTVIEKFGELAGYMLASLDGKEREYRRTWTW